METYFHDLRIWQYFLANTKPLEITTNFVKAQLHQRPHSLAWFKENCTSNDDWTQGLGSKAEFWISENYGPCQEIQPLAEGAPQTHSPSITTADGKLP